MVAGFAWIMLLATVAVCATESLEVPNFDTYDFETYVQEFKKSYAAGDRVSRRMNFEANMRKIKAQNEQFASGQSSWFAGVNEFSDWTPEEFHERLKMPAAATSVNIATVPKMASANPGAVDWRTKGAVTAVKSQGCGDCWAFSATETMESHYQIASGKLLELSPQCMVNCGYNPRDCGGQGGCQGANFDVAFNVSVTKGIALLETVPYDGADGACKPYQAAVTATGWVNNPVNDVNAFETALATKGPQSVTVAAGSWQNYRGGVFDTCAYGLLRPWLGLTLNHGVQAVGYTQDYWIVRNSWGPNWGEGGYIRLSRKHDNTTWTDKKPSDGIACKPYPETQTVAGECGILFSTAYPTGVAAAQAEIVV